MQHTVSGSVAVAVPDVGGLVGVQVPLLETVGVPGRRASYKVVETQSGVEDVALLPMVVVPEHPVWENMVTETLQTPELS